MTRVKICGITRPEDALAAANAGADAIGLVFYPDSPRAIDIATAWEILEVVPPFVTTVGLFVDADPEWIEEILVEVPLDVLQFHGNESPEQCEQFAHPYIKAIRMRPDTDLSAIAKRYADAQGLLLDTYRPGVPGGTGEVFDWSLVQQPCDKPIILAGGLTPDNVADAIAQVQPWAVDVSGGVEKEKGLKDSSKINAFMAAVKAADQ
ncbi:phosphoribosylanthranilate isomerase [Sulfurivirga caldicuralii]|uniref:N-(5'-phosphoribosyl)anthranilate isomerase n=1 Tax=Sulfurivirga caldicuralii TaxID=364032 RepID=A0A1N6ESB1_9GAMM|nr:phosphoribosylanthranilate isomerase [Sulfurivirga caldicuralii]SIN85880.1 phosphoribosylanthranilate isomerase [Sulfurivirga caldicuralii]